MTLKVKALSYLLADLTLDSSDPYNHDTSARIMGPFTITSVTSDFIGDSSDDYSDYGGSYTSGDHAVLIVPGSDPSHSRSNATAISATAGATTSGTFANVNDDDPSTGYEALLNSGTSLYIEPTGTSGTAKASVVGMNIKLTVISLISQNEDLTLQLQYYDNNLAAWQDLGDSKTIEATIWSFNITWTPELLFEGFVSGNDFLDGSDVWKIRIVSTSTNNVKHKLKVRTLEVQIYSDQAYNGAHFPISAYSGTDTGMNVSVDPQAAGVDVGDTYVVGMKDKDVLEACFNNFTALELKGMTLEVDANFSGYTARDFDDMNLLEILEYFCDKEAAHWWYDHDNNVVKIYKETSLASGGTLRTPSASDIASYAYDHKIESHVKAVKIIGASYKRADGGDVAVTYTYPGKDDTPIPTDSVKIDVQEKPEITSYTEARAYAEGRYNKLNTQNFSIDLVPIDFKSWLLRDRITLTIDEHSISNEPITRVFNSYNVADNNVYQKFHVGFQATTLVQRQSLKIARLQKTIKELQKAIRSIRANSEYATLRTSGSNADNTFSLDGDFSVGGDITGGGDMVLQDKMHLGRIELDNPDGGADVIIEVEGGAGSEKIQMPVDLQLNTDKFKTSLGNDIALPSTAADTLVTESGSQTLTNKSIGASQIDSGTLGTARIPSLDTSKITTGTFADARIAASNVTQHQDVLAVKGSLLTDAVDVANIPSLDTSKITTGTFADARIPSLDASKITTGTFADARIAASNVTQHQDVLAVKGSLLTDAVDVANIPSLPTSKITTGTFADARIAQSNVTQHQAALAINSSQMTVNANIDMQTHSITNVTNITATGDIVCETGTFSADTIFVGETSLSESAGDLIIDGYVVAFGYRGDLGTLISEFSTDGTFAGNSDSAVPTEKAARTYIDNQTIFGTGSSNTFYAPCMFSYKNTDDFSTGSGSWGNKKTGTLYAFFDLPFPTSSSFGKSLKCSALEIGLQDADSSNKIIDVWVLGMTGTGYSSLYTNSTDRTSVAVHTYEFTAIDLSSYRTIRVQIKASCNATDALDINTVRLRCYYE